MDGGQIIEVSDQVILRSEGIAFLLWNFGSKLTKSNKYMLCLGAFSFNFISICSF